MHRGVKVPCNKKAGHMASSKENPVADPVAAFEAERRASIAAYRGDREWQDLSRDWLMKAAYHRYTYNFSFLGRPIIQIPQDMVATQEIIWQVRPDLIIETGIAHGGSLVMSAAMLALLDYCDAAEAGGTLDPRKPRRRVLGVDIDIRAHNRALIETHPMASRIDMIQGSSIDPAVVAEVKARAAEYGRVLVCLDSNHTHEHVLAELEAYAPLVAKGSYCLVFDTVVDDMPEDISANRPWGPGDNPKTAVREYLRRLREEGRTGADGAPLSFVVDAEAEDKLLFSVAPEGYLKRV